MNLSVKEMPAATHVILKDRAERNHRSLNSEILAILESAVKSQRIDVNENLRKARSLRQKFSGFIAESDLQAAKRAGRS
jgi:antitoxin FitA